MKALHHPDHSLLDDAVLLARTCSDRYGNLNASGVDRQLSGSWTFAALSTVPQSPIFEKVSDE